MPPDTALPDLLPAPLRHALWQGHQLAELATSAVQPTGHATLDAELPGGGWPVGTLTELLTPAAGAAEWRLLAPALAALARGGRELVCVAPPHAPQAQALAALGLPAARLLWLATGLPVADAAWAAEQALKSRACGAVLWWVPPAAAGRRGDALRPDMARRLHLAAQGGESLLFLLRSPGCAGQSSPAPLRLRLEPAAAPPAGPGDLWVHVLKRRGPLLERPLGLALSAGLPEVVRAGLRRHARSRGLPAGAPVPAVATAVPMPMPTTAATAALVA